MKQETMSTKFVTGGGIRCLISRPVVLALITGQRTKEKKDAVGNPYE